MIDYTNTDADADADADAGESMPVQNRPHSLHVMGPSGEQRGLEATNGPVTPPARREPSVAEADTHPLPHIAAADTIPISLYCSSIAWCTRFIWYFSASL